ncbi:MAG: hypothetical protein QMD09_05135 [Desulfatibacillaceae bacterium]|nr:hypothetical protein [Desulfatibacillaceae bacterium]
MTQKRNYKCSECGKTISLESNKGEAPDCCGKAMIEELPVCTKQTVAEQYRFSDDNEPCDDARSGIKKGDN